MDYLERLDSALNTIEKEAEKMSGISKLTRTLGEVADELSGEKRELKDMAQDLKHWSSDTSKDIQQMIFENKTIHDTLSTSLDNARNENKKANGEISEKLKEMEEAGKAFMAETESKLTSILEEQNKIGNQISIYKEENDKANRTIKILVIATTVLSFISCCLSAYIMSMH